VTVARLLHFRPRHYDRWSQSLEVTCGEVMTGGEPPLLKKRNSSQILVVAGVGRTT
jgi:hypothetical protein